MTTTSTVPARPAHLFRYDVEGGAAIEGLSERGSSLTLDFAEKRARFESRRSEADQPNEPFGVFEGPLPDDVAGAILQQLRSPAFVRLQPRPVGGPGTSTLTFRHVEGEKVLLHSLSSRDQQNLAALNGLVKLLDRQILKLLTQPLAAVMVSVTPIASGPVRRLKWTLKNLGTQPLALRDPRRLARVATDWAGVRVAVYPEEVPGITAPPLEWRELHLERPLPGASISEAIRLEPGASFDALTEEWKVAQPGVRHLLQAVLVSYRGGAPSEKRPYPLRGAVFGEGVELVP